MESNIKAASSGKEGKNFDRGLRIVCLSDSLTNCGAKLVWPSRLRDIAANLQTGVLKPCVLHAATPFKSKLQSSLRPKRPRANSRKHQSGHYTLRFVPLGKARPNAAYSHFRQPPLHARRGEVFNLPRPAAQGRHVPTLPTSGRRAEAPPLRSLPPARSCHGVRSRLCESPVAAARSLRRLSSPRPSVSPLRGLPQAAGSASRLRERATCCSSTVSARPVPASRPHSGFSALRSGASALALSDSSAPSRVVPGQPGGG